MRIDPSTPYLLSTATDWAFAGSAVQVNDSLIIAGATGQTVSVRIGISIAATFDVIGEPNASGLAWTSIGDVLQNTVDYTFDSGANGFREFVDGAEVSFAPTVTTYFTIDLPVGVAIPIEHDVNFGGDVGNCCDAPYLGGVESYLRTTLQSTLSIDILTPGYTYTTDSGIAYSTSLGDDSQSVPEPPLMWISGLAGLLLLALSGRRRLLQQSQR
jgi:hypothetical protein